MADAGKELRLGTVRKLSLILGASELEFRFLKLGNVEGDAFPHRIAVRSSIRARHRAQPSNRAVAVAKAELDLHG